MDYLWIIITVALVITLAIAFGIKLKKSTKNSMKEANSGKALVPVATETTDIEQVQESGVVIPIERLPETTEIDAKNLFEITDRKVIARISQTIPAAAETATRTVANNALKKMEVYKAILPSGETLVKSKGMEGAVRGFSRGSKGIKSQANLVKVDVSKTTALASGVANVMNVGSLVVGQYYMSEINSKLETMTKSIDKIGDFQDREFKSRILSVITLVGEISQFSSEIMENDEQRNLKLASLENLKATATELLGQVNITISDITQNTPNPDYKEYLSKVDDFHKLVGYQNALVTVLEEISKLTYLLGKGFISTEQSYSTFNKYLKLSVQTRTLLGQWHDRQVKALSIDLEKERITKAGFEAVVSAIPSLFDGKYKYNELSQSFVNEISNQAKTIIESSAKPKQIYDNNVEIIIKGGNYYYLHE